MSDLSFPNGTGQVACKYIAMDTTAGIKKIEVFVPNFIVEGQNITSNDSARTTLVFPHGANTISSPTVYSAHADADVHLRTDTIGGVCSLFLDFHCTAPVVVGTLVRAFKIEALIITGSEGNVLLGGPAPGEDLESQPPPN